MAIMGKNAFIEKQVYKKKLEFIKKYIFSKENKFKNISIEFLSYREAKIQYVFSNFSKQMVPLIEEYKVNKNKNVFLNYKE